MNPKDAVGKTKPALRFVPPALTLHVALAMADGAGKYGPYNWREQPVSMTTYIEAPLRHLLALLDGENYTRDSNVHHAAAVAASMAIVLDALETGNLLDDRAKGGCASDIIERLTKKPEAQWALDDLDGEEIDAPIPFKLTPRPLRSGDVLRHPKTDATVKVCWVDRGSIGWGEHGWVHEDGSPIAEPDDEPICGAV